MLFFSMLLLHHIHGISSTHRSFSVIDFYFLSKNMDIRALQRYARSWDNYGTNISDTNVALMGHTWDTRQFWDAKKPARGGLKISSNLLIYWRKR
ncbi:hypothetical protein THIX_70214 [Thiomonas sp. X19]|nr:hypothetical protein THIX_70214 [Thiomonas sp. X19]